MPIKPENKHRYPANWPAIRKAILERAGNRCERCGVPNHAYRIIVGRVEIWTRNPMRAETWAMDGERVTRAVLTIAHLHDPSPENCDPSNLAALCQRCHNRLDAPMRVRNARQTRRAGKALGDLFDHA